MGTAVGRRTRAALALVGASALTALAGAAPASADAGKVLVFTGTAGTPNASSADAASAIQALGAANDFTVDVTNDATKISTANLANYRAVTFVHSAGDALNPEQEASLQGYVQGGGGFVGIGETAKLEEGNTFFDTLIGLTGNPRTTAASAVSSQDVEFLDRVHPATRGNPLLWKAHSDNYYAWTANPTGQVHTVARVRFNALPDGTSVTNDAVTRFTGTTNTIQPQQERALSWCRDVQQGRSFYTGLGGTAASYQDDAVKKQLLGAIEWAAGMVRGNCKATINSNYTATRLTPQNPAVPNPAPPGDTQGLNPFTGEIDGLAMAKDGRVFYAGRAVCFQNMPQTTNWDAPLDSLGRPTVGKGCGTIHVWDPNVAGDDNQNPAKVAKVADLTVFGAKGGGSESGPTSKDEQGILGIALDPDFTNGRPYIYVQYHPYFMGEQGTYTTDPAKQLGPGFDRQSFMGERRLSRFTYDPATKTLVAGSEKVIFHWMTQVYSCCHLGGSMDWDSKGNLYFASGDNTGNTPNSNNGGYTNSSPNYTVPVDGVVRSNHNTTPGGGTISFADARQTSGNTNAYEGKLLRIKPMANPGNVPGVGSTYTIPDADAPNGPNLFPEDSQAVKDKLAKPEVFAMGVRNLYSIDIDSKTDKISASWVGPDQGTNSTTWGPAKTENATQINKAGNYGWPYCQAGNRFDYRAKLPATSGGGSAANLSDNVRGTVGGGADGQTGAFWDCTSGKPVANDSPYNTGLKDIPAPKPVNIWYGPQGGCYDFKRNANGVAIYNATNTAANDENAFRRCPFAFGGSQAPMTAGTYRRPDNAKPGAWPAYWDGRWFLSDFAGGNNIRHALLMDPATEFDGGAPVSADSLYGIVPTSLMNNNRTIDLDFGADGALYVASYSGSNFTISNANTGVWRFAYVGGDDTPGPDPQYVTGNSSKVAFNIGKSGGVSYEWSFPDGSKQTGPTATYTYLKGGKQQATLTVTYADGQVSSKTFDVDVPTTEPSTVTATVPTVLGLTLGTPATFGGIVPAVASTYTASTTANVVSSAGNAALTVTDPGTTAPGHLVHANGTSVLPQALKARATNAANPNTAYAEVSGTPLSLLSWAAPISNDAVTLGFQQPVAANDALRAGQYSKTLLFTLSTTTP
jgi:glucose/arabinose dehydrogenase/type 1 glutamine amidotransferase